MIKKFWPYAVPGKYIHHVQDTIPPASAFVDQTWLQS